METKCLGLVWITVNDLKQAVKFYTEVIGLKLKDLHEQYGWAELEGVDGGARLGIAQKQPSAKDIVQPGQNAVMTFTVEDIQHATEHLLKKGAHLVGELQVVPGHVKLQMAKDIEGNYLQLVELIQEKIPVTKKMESCCNHKH